MIKFLNLKLAVLATLLVTLLVSFSGVATAQDVSNNPKVKAAALVVKEANKELNRLKEMSKNVSGPGQNGSPGMQKKITAAKESVAKAERAYDVIVAKQTELLAKKEAEDAKLKEIELAAEAEAKKNAELAEQKQKTKQSQTAEEKAISAAESILKARSKDFDIAKQAYTEARLAGKTGDQLDPYTNELNDKKALRRQAVNDLEAVKAGKNPYAIDTEKKSTAATNDNTAGDNSNSQSGDKVTSGNGGKNKGSGKNGNSKNSAPKMIPFGFDSSASTHTKNPHTK